MEDVTKASRRPSGEATSSLTRQGVVEMVLAGSINKQIVGYINEAGGK